MTVKVGRREGVSGIHIGYHKHHYVERERNGRGKWRLGI